jgi:hypothetical protein
LYDVKDGKLFKDRGETKIDGVGRSTYFEFQGAITTGYNAADNAGSLRSSLMHTLNQFIRSILRHTQ